MLYSICSVSFSLSLLLSSSTLFSFHLLFCFFQIFFQVIFFVFFFNDPATPEIYPLPLHDALPISPAGAVPADRTWRAVRGRIAAADPAEPVGPVPAPGPHARRGSGRLPPRVADAELPHRQSRSEEHTSELQSQSNLVCRLLLEKKN